MTGHEQHGPNPYVFVVGCPRSGTTLLQRMLDHHPMLAVANDSHLIPQPLEDLPIGVDPPLTPDLVEWVGTYRAFSRLQLPDGAVQEAASGARTYGEFVGALYNEYGRLRGKRLAGEKSGRYVRSLPRLNALFPWVRNIHIIRDGRDVALSTLDWARGGKGPSKLALWEEEPVGLCALRWRSYVNVGREDGAALGRDRYREVLYEDLVARPEAELSALAAFLGLPDAVEMATYYVGRTRHKAGISTKKAWLPPTPGLRNWRTDLPEPDRAVFEALAGDLLVELGYELSVEHIRPDIAERAERCRVWWESEQLRRQARPAPA